LAKTPRTVVEIRDDLHSQVKRLALLNDLRIHELTNVIIADFLQDAERVKTTIKKLHSTALFPGLLNGFAREDTTGC